MKSIILIAYENDCYNYVYLYHSLSSRGYDVHVIIGDFFSLITGNNYVQNILVDNGVPKEKIFDFKEEIIGINKCNNVGVDYDFLNAVEKTFLSNRVISHLIYADVYLSGSMHNRDNIYRPSDDSLVYLLVERLIKKSNKYFELINPDLIFTFGAYNFVRNYFYEKSLINDVIFLSLIPSRINDICFLSDRSIFKIPSLVNKEMLRLLKEGNENEFKEADDYIARIKVERKAAYNIDKYDYNFNLKEKLSFWYQFKSLFRPVLSLPRAFINDTSTLVRGGVSRNYFYLYSVLYLYYISVRTVYRNSRYFRNKSLNNVELPLCNSVFYSLHTIPEDGVFTQSKLTDELYNIMRISKVLPSGYKLVIKLHSTMLLRNSASYPIEWFNRISNLHNTYFVTPLMSGVDIISNSKGVATIAGTSLLEAALMGKPAFAFGDSEYSVLDGIHTFSEESFLFNLNNYALKKENNHRYYIQAIFNQGVKVDLTKYMHVDKRTSSTKEYKNRFVDILSNEIIETFKNVKE